MTLVSYSFILSCCLLLKTKISQQAPPLLDPPHDPHNMNREEPEFRVLITVVQVPRERGEILARQHSMAFMETSARTGVNVAQVSVTLNLN